MSSSQIPAPPHAPPLMGRDTQPAPLDGHRLLEQLGREVAGTLSPALDRVTTLTDTGRIDRQSLRVLRDEIDRARHAGIVGQRLARLAQGQVTVAAERLDLTALLQDALAQRSREMDVRGIAVRQSLAAVDVVSDPALLFALLQAALDWSFEHAAGRIDLQLELRDWPVRARVRSAFAYHPVDETGRTQSTAPADLQPDNASPRGSTLDTVSWRLVEHTALALGLSLRRRDARGSTEFVLDFPPSTTLQSAAPAPSTTAEQRPAPQPAAAPKAAAQPSAPESTDDPKEAQRRAVTAQPLAGHHVLVLAAKRDLRLQIREALRDMDLLLDFVTSVEEARLFCADALPHALVYEAAQTSSDFVQLRDALLAQKPSLGLIQITDDGAGFDVLTLGTRDFASVGRDGLAEALPAALMFELFRDS